MLKSIVSALALFALLAAPTFAEDAKMDRTISVSGQGLVRAVPDLAVVSIGVNTNALTAREALDINSKSMALLIDTLGKAGVDNKDMATSSFNVGARYDYGANGAQPPKVTGYDVSNMLTVTVRKIDDLGELLDVAVSNGSNAINGISFSVSKTDSLLDEARTAAVADARRKAEVYAKAGGFKLGDIVALAEGVNMPAPVPYMTKTARAEGASAVPISQGEQTLTVDVSITYMIK